MAEAENSGNGSVHLSGTHWRDEEVLKLIKVWSEEEIYRETEDSKKKRKGVYGVISQRLANTHCTQLTLTVFMTELTCSSFALAGIQRLGSLFRSTGGQAQFCDPLPIEIFSPRACEIFCVFEHSQKRLIFESLSTF